MVKKNAGVTMIELLMVIAILGFFVFLAPSLIKMSAQFFILGKAKLELQREARAAMYLMTREMRQAQSNSIVIDQASNQPYYSRIRFTKIQGTTVQIYQSGSNLILTMGTRSTTLSKNVAYLAMSFPQSDDMTIVSIAMTLSQSIYGGATKALHMASEKVRVMN